LEVPGEVEGVDPGDEVERAVALDLEDDRPVAAPGQRAAPDAPVLLGDLAGRRDREPGVRLLAGEAAAALGRELPGSERPPLEPVLAAPLPVERPRFILSRRQAERRAQNALDAHRLLAAVLQPDRPLDQVVLGVEA